MKTCPYCAEEIQEAAIVCKHCGRDLSIPEAPAVSAPSTDAKYISLQNQLISLKEQRAKVRPAVPLLIGILTLFLGILMFPGFFGIVFGIIGIAGLLSGLTAIAKGSNINQKINQVNDQLQQFAK